MTIKKRIEDMGRIAEKAHALLEHKLFDIQAKEDADAIGILPIIDRIEDVRQELGDIWHIARWGDDEEADNIIK